MLLESHGLTMKIVLLNQLDQCLWHEYGRYCCCMSVLVMLLYPYVCDCVGIG